MLRRSVRNCLVWEKEGGGGGRGEWFHGKSSPPVFWEGEDGWKKMSESWWNRRKYLFYSVLHYSFNHSAVHTLVLIQFNTFYLYVYSVHCTRQFNFLCLYIAQYPIYCLLRILDLKHIKCDEKIKKYFWKLGEIVYSFFSKFS